MRLEATFNHLQLVFGENKCAVLRRLFDESGTPLWENKPNHMTSYQLQPCGLAAILELGCRENKCADITLINKVYFQTVQSNNG
jgi:hypothetical protein